MLRDDSKASKAIFETELPMIMSFKYIHNEKVLEESSLTYFQLLLFLN